MALSAVEEIVGVLHLRPTKSREFFLMSIWSSGYSAMISYIWPLHKNIINEAIAFLPPTLNTIK